MNASALFPGVCLGTGVTLRARAGVAMRATAAAAGVATARADAAATHRAAQHREPGSVPARPRRRSARSPGSGPVAETFVSRLEPGSFSPESSRRTSPHEAPRLLPFRVRAAGRIRRRRGGRSEISIRVSGDMPRGGPAPCSSLGHSLLPARFHGTVQGCTLVMQLPLTGLYTANAQRMAPVEPTP